MKFKNKINIFFSMESWTIKCLACAKRSKY